MEEGEEQVSIPSKKPKLQGLDAPSPVLKRSSKQMEEGEEQVSIPSKKPKLMDNNNTRESPSPAGLKNKLTDDEKNRNNLDSLMVRLFFVIHCTVPIGRATGISRSLSHTHTHTHTHYLLIISRCFSLHFVFCSVWIFFNYYICFPHLTESR